MFLKSIRQSQNDQAVDAPDAQPEQMSMPGPNLADDTLEKPTTDGIRLLYLGDASVLIWADAMGVHRCDISRSGNCR